MIPMKNNFAYSQMKKFSLLITAVFFFTTISRAQGYSHTKDNGSDKAGKLQFGLKIGANFSNVYDANGEEFKADPKFGLAAGVFVLIPIGNYLGFQPEALFSQKGFKATGKILGSSYDFTRTTNYIDIPLLLAIKPAGFVTILVGPQYSFLMKQKDVFKNAILSGSQEQEFKNDNLRKNILGFTGGVDINFEHVVLGLRAGWDIQNNNGDGTSSTPKYKNVLYQATLGIRL